MVGTIPGRASVRDNLRNLPDALCSPTSGRATPDLPAYGPFQMDGGHSDDADGGWVDAVPSARARRPNEPGGGPRATEQDDCVGMPILDLRGGVSVWVRWEDRGRSGRAERAGR